MVEYKNEDIMCPSELILMLRNNLNESLARTLIERNIRLFKDFIKLSENKVMVQDIRNVAQVVDNLFGCLEENELYLAPLHCLLIMLSNPPHMNKVSDAIQSVYLLKDYLNILGGLLLKLVAEKTFQKMILSIIHNLFSKDARKESSVIDITWCVEALELSSLPLEIANVLKLDFHHNRHEFLIVIDVISDLSRHCCLKMINSGMINILLSSLAKTDTNIEVSHISDNQCLNVNLNLIWRLVEICKTEECSKHIEAISSTALKDFIMVLTRIDREENNLKSSKIYRNNIFSLLLELIHTFPDLDLSIVKNYFIELVRNRRKEIPLSELEEENVESTPIYKKLDVHYEKIFLSILKYLVTSSSNTQDHPFLTEVMELLLGYLTCWSNPKDQIVWSSVQASQLLMAFKILPSISAMLMDYFISKNGPNRLMQIIELFRHEMIGITVLFEATLCLLKIFKMNEKSTGLPTLMKQIDIHIMIKLTKRCLEMEVMSTYFQDLLTNLLCIINSLTCQDNLEPCIRDSLFTIAFDSIQRILFLKKVDSVLSNKLNVAVSEVLWKCVIQFPESWERFIQANGIYIILDLVMILPHILKIKYLTILADLCEDPVSVPYLITWRTKSKMDGVPIGSGILTVLCNLWRQEEKLIGVKRDKYGCIEDWQEPLMGEVQRNLQKEMRFEAFSGMFSMFADMRIKIYIIIYYLTIRYKDITTIAENHFRLNYLPLNSYDKITMKLAENYFKLSVGGIWKDLAQDNVTHRPSNEMSPVYRNIIQSLAEKHDKFTQNLISAQKEIIEQQENEAIEKEEDLQCVDNSCKLAHTLKALAELCLNARIESRELLLQEKTKQKKQIEDCRKQEGKEDVIDTYPKNLLITTMTAGRKSMYQCILNGEYRSPKFKSHTENGIQIIKNYFPVPSHSDTCFEKDFIDSNKDYSDGKQDQKLDKKLKPTGDTSRLNPKHYKCFI
ncbi:cilia- and flagella-associated protein 69 [Nilaparvata lugens]|uniref:cilia- and flagella-associated protein 69 n=1 Tax=Nilaparvata lugens TaxID=108931 RepID=UPI00193D0BDD|nr:cilia- and flagella-associated protein 69 [Nilaparvata lugens]